ASCELLHRLGKEYEKPQWGLHYTHIGDYDATVTEHTVVSKPFCNLVHFKRHLPPGVTRDPDPTVLLVAPMSGHHATLLRYTVRAQRPNHEIYVTDLIDARMVPQSAGQFGLNDYVRYVQEFMRHLGPNTHVMSVCQPTVPVMAAISLMASNQDP